LMPKLVGTQLTLCTLTQITGAVALQPQAGKSFFSSENCKFNFLSWPQTLSVNIIDFYVERVKKSVKLTKNCVYLCHRESCWSNLVFMAWLHAHLNHFVPANESQKVTSNPAVAFSNLEQESNGCQ
jgi:hypothetical protein